MCAPPSGMPMMQCPSVPAVSNVSQVESAAIQNGSLGFCVGRGSDVTFSKLWKRPRAVTFSSSSKRRTCSSPSSKRARLSSIEMPKRANSCGKKARANPTSRRPPEIASTIPICPASLSGLLNTGSAAPVISRVERVSAAAALRKISGSGL